MVALRPTYSTIWLSGDVGTRDPSALQQLLTSPSGNFRYVSTRLTWKANRRKISVGPDSRTRHSTAVMYIGRNHLARFRSTDQVERSCAINSMAHEITHTMSASSTMFETAVTDTGGGRVGAGNNPFASYFVGAVAQCTYLQELGRVTSEGLQQCIETFGARVFWGGRCGSYKNGEAVKWPKDRRPGGS